MNLALTFITLGALFLAGLLADQIGRRTRLPRVTLLLACGVVAGGSGLDLIPPEAQEWFEFLSISALTMVAFLLGGALTRGNIRTNGRAIIFISVAIVLATLGIVFAGLFAFGLPAGLALILAAIATATDPAAMQDTLDQSSHRGRFTQTLRGVVAIDDAWGLIAFSLVLVLVGHMNGIGENDIFGAAIWEIGGAGLLGICIGLPAALLSGRIGQGEPLQSEALAIVFLTAGLGIWLEVSYLIAGMTAGAIIVNTARHHEYAFHEIEGIRWPFMLLFFILAGASLEVGTLWAIGGLGALCVVLRIAARIIGGWVGATLAQTPKRHRPLYGLALLPQAGVAVGMALIAAEKFPDWSETIMVLAVGTTVVFELIGPPLTLRAVDRAFSGKR